jgi:hypothetical protein
MATTANEDLRTGGVLQGSITDTNESGSHERKLLMERAERLEEEIAELREQHQR